MQNIDEIKAHIKNAFNPPDVAIFSEDDCISNEIIEFLRNFKISKFEFRKLLLPPKDVKSRHQLVEEKCEICGKIVKTRVTASYFLGMLSPKHTFSCEECKQKEKKKQEHIITHKELEKEKNTIIFIDCYLDPNKFWRKGMSPFDKTNDMLYQDVFWDAIQDYILQMDYKDFLKTPYWVAISELVRRRHKYVCEMCGKGGVLHVHHPNYEFHGKELQNIKKLKCLCADCHELFHNK